MPTYDYECAKCGHTFDAFQNMSDDPLKKCPECGKNGLKRLIGGGLGVIFKGSGFYSTDSRSSSAKSGSTSKGTDGGSSDTATKTEKTDSSSSSDSSGSKDAGKAKSEKIAG
ncbi:MAG: FmdB family zinc ribbon protein [Spirochaetota bacterium]